MAAGLYVDGNEYHTSFEEAVRIGRTPSELRYMLVTLYQQGADPQRLVERHQDALAADIQGEPASVTTALLHRLIELSYTHGGRLLRTHPFFVDASETTLTRSNEVERAEYRVQSAMTSENRQSVHTRYRRLKEQKNKVFDELLQAFIDRRREDRVRTDGKVFFLQGHAGTGKTLLLSLLRDMVEAQGMFMKI